MLNDRYISSHRVNFRPVACRVKLKELGSRSLSEISTRVTLHTWMAAVFDREARKQAASKLAGILVGSQLALGKGEADWEGYDYKYFLFEGGKAKIAGDTELCKAFDHFGICSGKVPWTLQISNLRLMVADQPRPASATDRQLWFGQLIGPGRPPLYTGNDGLLWQFALPKTLLVEGSATLKVEKNVQTVAGFSVDAGGVANITWNVANAAKAKAAA